MAGQDKVKVGEDPDPSDASMPSNDAPLPAVGEEEKRKKDDDEDYSIWTVPQKRAILLSGSLLGWFSPMTASIYYPATAQIAGDLGVSVSKINLTVTTYLIIQGLAPMMIAGFSDKAGRRPAYIICFTIYMIANLTLALQDNYVALLVLRMLQSAGSSGTVALAQGLVGDCVLSAERGKYVAYASVGSILGPSVSPILGGVIAKYAGWHWIFWFLLILSGAAFIPMLLFLPETCRNLVGNGSYPPPPLSKNFSSHILHRNRQFPIDEEKLSALRQNYRLVVPSPLPTLRILLDPFAAPILLACGLSLACYYAVCSGIAPFFADNYSFDSLQASLVFIPIGVGGLVATLTTGKAVDWNYARHARRLGFPVRKNKFTDHSEFPLELARMQVSLPLLLLGSACIIAYGWTMQARVNLAGPIVLLFFVGYAVQGGFQVLNVLMVDLYAGQAATATAANNLARCLLGAASSAAIIPMSDAVGRGWAYTILAVLFVLSCIGPAVSMRYGLEWRRRKREREMLRKAQG